MPPRSRGTATGLSPAERTDVEEAATLRCRSLVSAGTLSCDASRALADSCLRQPGTRQLFGSLLSARFSEVIVDEAQDCGQAELGLLDLLREHEVTVIAVADTDQSIYEFRRAEPSRIRAFASSFPARLTLDGNYRSSPAICAVNNSLRAGDRKEHPAGNLQNCQAPVQLLGYGKPQDVATAVQRILGEHGLAAGDAIFLAYRSTDARQCAGQAQKTSSAGDHKLLALARACTVLRTLHSSGPERLKAVELIERTLRLAAAVPEGDPRVTSHWLRDAAVRLALTADPAAASAQDFARCLRELIRAIDWPDGVCVAATLHHMLKAPEQKAWQPDTGPQMFRSATIHSVKGQEFPAVVLVIPKARRSGTGDSLDHWEGGLAGEPRRVLYVGASRAQRLLVLATPSEQADRVASLLESGAVPHTRLDG